MKVAFDHQEELLKVHLVFNSNDRPKEEGHTFLAAKRIIEHGGGSIATAT